MAKLLSTETKARLHLRLAAVLGDSSEIRKVLPDPPEPPKTVTDWLARLNLLYGVPFNYLVPDEGMLPPESIRFFTLDGNWVDAMIDGAFSIGRNFNATADTASMNLDRAVHPQLHAAAAAGVPAVRARMLGLNPPPVVLQTITGFVLRSSVVSAYKNLGVNVYPFGHTPDDPNPILLPLLRLEALGPQSNTLLCLVDGDAYRVDIHEAPEHLHYAIDTYQATPLSASKVIHDFTISGDSVTVSTNTQQLDITSCLRASSPRTLNMTALAAQISAANNNLPVDSAVMGFEMTEGVGMVSFLNRNPQ